MVRERQKCVRSFLLFFPRQFNNKIRKIKIIIQRSVVVLLWLYLLSLLLLSPNGGDNVLYMPAATTSRQRTTTIIAAKNIYIWKPWRGSFELYSILSDETRVPPPPSLCAHNKKLERIMNILLNQAPFNGIIYDTHDNERTQCACLESQPDMHVRVNAWWAPNASTWTTYTTHIKDKTARRFYSITCNLLHRASCIYKTLSLQSI